MRVNCEIKKNKSKNQSLDQPVKNFGELNLYLQYVNAIERSVADAIGQCFTVLAQKQSATWILEGDIKACFDRISHSWLLAHIPMDKSVLRKWLAAGFMEEGRFYSTEAGTPQGGIASPTLAMMALTGLEAAAKAAAPRNEKVHVVVYADGTPVQA